MRLGELLVHSRQITAEQLDAALRQQVVYGARLGTNLIELGYADLDTVAHALARLLQVPASLQRHFEHHDRQVTELVPRELAARYAAFPIAYADTSAGRRLVTCIRNPRDQGAVSALTRAAGTQVLACVAPELEIFFWLEHVYGVRRQERYRQAHPGSSTPLPRAQSDRIQAVGQADALSEDVDIDFDIDEEVEEEQPMPGLQLVDLDHSDVERDLSQYSIAGKQDSLSSMATGLAAAQTATPAPVARTTDSMHRIAEVQDVLMTAAEARSAIGRATDRNGVGNAVVAFLRKRFGAGLMLIAKDDMALGHRGCGGTFDDSTVESILIPLSAPSMFRTAVEARQTCRGAPPSSGKAIHERFFKLFSLDDEPPSVVVTPVMIRDRVVCLLYAHAAHGGGVTDELVAEIEYVAAAVGEAYLRLIREAKRSG